MKRKFLLTLMFSVLLALSFVLLINASYIYKDESGNEMFRFEIDSSSIITEYTGEFPKTDNNGNPLTWYVTATTTSGSDTIKTVASVNTLDENYFTLSNGTYSYKTSTVTNKNVVSVYFPSNAGITKLSLSGDGYRSAYSYTFGGTEILFVYLPNTLTELPSRIGQGTQMLICDIPLDTPIKSISHVAFHKAKCLREINIPSTVKEIVGKSENDGCAFYQCSSLKRVNIGENSQLEIIGTRAFYENLSLEYIKIPDGVLSVGNNAFSKTKLTESPFSASSRCTYIGGRAFTEITTLKNFIVPAGLTSVELLGSSDYGPLALSTVEEVTFGNYTSNIVFQPGFFARAVIGKLTLPEGPTHIPHRFFISATCKEIVIPNSVITIGERVLQSAKVEIIKFGANFSYFTNSAKDHHSLTNATSEVKEVYIPYTFYQNTPDAIYQVSHAFEFGNCSNIKFFFTGDSSELTQSIANFRNDSITTASGTNNWKFTGATHISYEAYIANPDNYKSGNYIIYGYNHCAAFYGGAHEEDNNSCVINCTRCKTIGVMEENPIHNFIKEIAYKNGYATIGEITSCCANAGCECAVPQISIASPIFNSFLYSTKENNEVGIGLVLSIGVDKDALSLFEEVAGTPLKYGALAVAGFNVGENGTALDNDGKAGAGVICAEVSASGVSKLDLVIRGSAEAWDSSFEGAEEGQTIKDLPFYVLGFFIDNNGVNYFYDDKASASLLELNTVTYNGIN